MSTSEDNRLTWGLIIDVLDALEKHGYHRGDNQHVGSAVELIAPLAHAYEGNQEQPGSAHPSPPRPPHQTSSHQPDHPAGPDTAAVSPGDRRIILAALDEAADLKRDRAVNCSDCADQSCGTCEFRLKAAQAYERVAARLLGTEKPSTPPSTRPRPTPRRSAASRHATPGSARNRGRAMTSTGKAQAIEGIGTSLARRVARWIGARQQAISDRAHASADARARARGWTVTASTGRFGFGARAYRDPRFDARQHQDRPGGLPQLAESPSMTSSPARGDLVRQQPGRQHHDL